ncbi:MAG: PEP-CTERM sorting domain-containing protein, partial [Terriglobales bacterium]
NFYTVDDAAPGQLTLADIGLYPSYTVNGTTVPGESFIISVGALSSGGPGWPLNTPMLVQTPEPATILLLLTGLIFLVMAGWSTRRRALVRAE